MGVHVSIGVGIGRENPFVKRTPHTEKKVEIETGVEMRYVGEMEILKD